MPRPRLAPVLLTLLILSTVWKLCFPAEFSILNHPDGAHQALPWLRFLVSEWHQGRLATWDPFSFGGLSLVGQLQPAVYSPLSWLHWTLCSPDLAGLLRGSNYYALLLHFIAALAAYALARTTKLSPLGSLIAGFLYSASAINGSLAWLNILAGSALLPLPFLGLLRARTRHPWPWTLAAGLSLGMLWLSGHYMLPLIATLAIGSMLFSRDHRLRVAVVLALALTVGAVQIVPALQYGASSQRWVGLEEPVMGNSRVPYEAQAAQALKTGDFIGLFVPGYPSTLNVFLGVFALMLMAVALTRFRFERRIRSTFLLGLMALIFSVGGLFALHGVAYAVLPGIDKARWPALTFVFVQLAWGLTAGRGAELLVRGHQHGLTRWFWRAGWTGIALILGVLYVAVFITGTWRLEADQRVLLPVPMLLAAAWILQLSEARALSRTFLASLVTLFLVLETSASTSAHLASRYATNGPKYVDILERDRDLADWIRQHPEVRRIDYDPAELPYNFGLWYGIPSYRSFANALPLQLPSAEQAGVTHVVSKKPLEGEVLFTSKSGFSVYRR